MKAGWQTVELGSIAELRGRIGWKGLTAKEYTQSGPRFLSVHSLNYGDYVDFRDAFHISQERYDESPEIMLQQDDILICKDGAGIGKLGVVPDVSEPTTINSSLLLIRSGPKVLPKFLYFCLLSPYFQHIVQSRLEGATTPHLYQRDITQFPVFLPPLEEQKRIVAVLDVAFAALDRARTHAKTNLKNARELFVNYLADLFSGTHLGWSGCTVGDLVTLQRGFDITKKDQRPGTVPVVSSGGAKSFHDEFKACAPGVIIGRKGSIGNVHFAEENYWPHDTTLWVKDFKGNNARLVYYLLKGLRLSELDTGAANPSLNRNLVHPLSVSWPTGLDQSELANGIESIEAKASKAETIYEDKLSDLECLRQSLLQKAFAGELS